MYFEIESKHKFWWKNMQQQKFDRNTMRNLLRKRSRSAFLWFKAQFFGEETGTPNSRWSTRMGGGPSPSASSLTSRRSRSPSPVASPSPDSTRRDSSSSAAYWWRETCSTTRAGARRRGESPTGAARPSPGAAWSPSTTRTATPPLPALSVFSPKFSTYCS